MWQFKKKNKFSRKATGVSMEILFYGGEGRGVGVRQEETRQRGRHKAKLEKMKLWLNLAPVSDYTHLNN